jgi:hypothetical protein
MKPGKLVRRLILAVVAVITISSLAGCIVVPARGYGGPAYYHGYYR